MNREKKGMRSFICYFFIVYSAAMHEPITQADPIAFSQYERGR
jgi:hypothetical protein